MNSEMLEETEIGRIPGDEQQNRFHRRGRKGAQRNCRAVKSLRI